MTREEKIFKAAANKRMAFDVSEFPPYVQYRICKIKEWIKEKYGEVDKVLLLGSYAKGEWIDDLTDQEFIDLKHKATGNVKHSDFDIIIYPLQKGGIFEVENFKIHVWKSDDYYKQNTIRIC